LQLRNGTFNFWRDLEIAVLFFQLINVMCLEVRIGEETGSNGLKASVWYWEEDATEMDDITRAHHAG
jgi:hypothetical protein